MAIPSDLPPNTLLEFRPTGAAYAALPGALAYLQCYTRYSQYSNQVIVKWVRNGRDRGQCDGDYSADHFIVANTSTPQTTSKNVPCNCSFANLAIFGCRYLKIPDANGVIHF